MATYELTHPDHNLTNNLAAWGSVKKDGIYQLTQDVFLSKGFELDPRGWWPADDYGNGRSVLRRETYEQNPQKYPQVTVVKAGTRIRLDNLYLMNRIWGKLLLVDGLLLDGPYAGRHVQVNSLCEMNWGKEYRELKAVNSAYLIPE